MKKLLLSTNIYYGWFIVAAGFLIMSTAWGIIYNCTSLFIKPISEDMGFNRSDSSMILTLSMTSQMFIALVSGKIYTRVKMKKLMKLSTITLVISYFTFSLANSLIMLYLISIIASISSAFLTVLPLSLILSNWFNEKRGFVIGIAFMGSGIGAMILSTFIGMWITTFGWRVTYQILSLIMLVIITPCTFFIIEVNPKDIGLLPYGNLIDKNIFNLKTYDEGITFLDAIKAVKFHVLIICIIIGTIGMTTSFYTISPHLSDKGYDIIFSANISALTMGSLAISKIILGGLFDKFGVKLATSISVFANMIGIIGLYFAHYKIALVMIIVGTGLGNAFGTIGLPIITEKVFGRKDYSTVYGFLFAASNLGGVIGPTLNGAIFDKTGSYNAAYVLMTCITIALLVAFNIILPNNKYILNEGTLVK